MKKPYAITVVIIIVIIIATFLLFNRKQAQAPIGVISYSGENASFI